MLARCEDRLFNIGTVVERLAEPGEKAQGDYDY